MTKIKICGITNEQDAGTAIRAGADYVGLIFAPSKRQIIPETARRIMRSYREFQGFVGVFRNGKKKNIEEVIRMTGLKMVQFHGDETPAFCNYFINRQIIVIKAIPIPADASAIDRNVIERYTKVDYILLDTMVHGCSGGTGITLPCAVLRQFNQIRSKKLFVGGGLHAGNIKSLIECARPFGVDASSCLECDPGHKDSTKIIEFINTVRMLDTNE